MRRHLPFIAALSLTACLKGPAPTTAGASLARLNLDADVVAPSTDTLEVRISYLDATSDNATVPVTLVDKRLPIGSGTTRVPLTVDLSTCLVDPHRAFHGPACQLDVSAMLIQDGVVLDSVVLAPVDAAPGAVIDITPAFTLAPVDTIIVTPTTDTIAVGATVLLMDTIKATSGVVVTGQRVTWASTRPTVATVDTAGRVTGVSPGTTTITASAAGKQASATIVVQAPSTLVLGSTTLAFAATPGGTLPAARSIAVTSSNPGQTINGLSLGSVSYGTGQPTNWLSATLAATSTPSAVVLVPTTTNLAVGGPYSATVSLSGAGAAAQTVTITYTIGAGPTIVVTPTAVTDTSIQGSPTVRRTVAITNGGGGSLIGLTTSVAYAGGATGWLAATLNQTTAPATLTLASTAGALAAGTYAATVTVGSTSPAVVPQTVGVTFVVETPPAFTLSPSTLAFSAQHAAATPAAQTVTVKQVVTGPAVTGLTVGTITYATGQPTGWLTATLGGSATPTTLTIVPNSTALAAGGPYTATVPVTSAGTATHAVTVTYTVTPSPVIAVAPASVADTVLQAAGVTTKTVAVSNTGGGTLSGLSAAVSYGTGTTGWLTATLNRTTAPATLTLGFTAGALTPATYTATVTLSSTVSGVTPKAIPITFVVQTGPTMALSATTRAFNSYAYGSKLPAAQTITVTNTGHGSLGTITTGTPTYGAGATNWLSLTVAGTTVTVHTTTTNLPLGTFSATVPISAASAKNSPQTLTVTVASAVTFTKVASGSFFSCGVTTAATLYCWGRNNLDQLGATTPDSTAIPQLVAIPGNGVTDVEVGLAFACALTTNHVAYCWGSDNFGQVGNGTTATSVATPTAITGFSFSSITTGAFHACGTQTSDSTRVCWGSNASGQLGFGQGAPATQPTPKAAPTQKFTSISAGYSHTCAIAIGGQFGQAGLYCWGGNGAGQMGWGASQIGVGSDTPILISTTLVSVSAGRTHTCALDAQSNPFCWGDDAAGEIGLGSTGDTIGAPAQIQGPQFATIHAGDFYTCGIGTSGTAYCWGNNLSGNIGNGTTGGNAIRAVAVPGQTAASALVPGTYGFTTCDVDAGVAYCWGTDLSGALGNNTFVTGVASPSQVFGQPAPAGVTP